MAEPIVFKYGSSRMFRWAKCINVRKGDYWDVPAADGAEPVPGSDTLVVCPDIMLVLAGAFELQVPELADPIPMPAGEAGSPQRFRSALKIVATVDDSSYVCLIPRDHSFWQRQVGFVAAGEEITIESPDCEDAHIFVASGGLQADGLDILAGTMRQVGPGEHVLTAVHDTHFVHVWR